MAYYAHFFCLSCLGHRGDTAADGDLCIVNLDVLHSQIISCILCHVDKTTAFIIIPVHPHKLRYFIQY